MVDLCSPRHVTHHCPISSLHSFDWSNRFNGNKIEAIRETTRKNYASPTVRLLAPNLASPTRSTFLEIKTPIGVEQEEEGDSLVRSHPKATTKIQIQKGLGL